MKLDFTPNEVNAIMRVATNVYSVITSFPDLKDMKRQLFSVNCKICAALAEKDVPPQPAKLDSDDSDPNAAYRVLSVRDLFEMYAQENTYDGGYTCDHTAIADALRKRLEDTLKRLDRSDGSKFEVREIYYKFIGV